jgi:hypothetical protein
VAHNPQLRASDEDRDRTAVLLREHHAVGRLTPDEFSERLDKVFAAKTIGDLEVLLRDLPAIDLYRLPDSRLTRAPRPAQAPARRRAEPSSWGAAWVSVWLLVTVTLTVIWVLSGHHYFWPGWVIGPWGALLVGRYWAVGRGGRGQLGPGSGQGQLPGREDPPG